MNAISIRKGILGAAVAAAIPLVAMFGTTTAILYPTPAAAFFCSNCSTNVQQGMQYAKDVETALNTAQQLQTQINQYNQMIKQGLAFPDSVFSSIRANLQQVADLYENTKAIGTNVANLDEQFREQYKGYSDWLNVTGNASAVMPDRYTQWAEEGSDNARTALKAVGANVGTFESEDTTLSRLINRSSGAAGQMQAIQAGNEINAQNVQQLQKLRDLIGTQITMQSNYLAQDNERRAADDAFNENFRKTPVQNTGRDKGY
ncbi:P-type conjugative transfer protein TrbJ [Tatumella sp. UCD-D_suzukii]|uniref:P-type conjugative transfer protein TrbJ n=1 Tax=Tatumella sp. UCD-D_suzukii TaxID=1408192 RepID=UPI0004700915|nr:P-type conjugative transfer protein TrbJ [Tatumella sp. UCD-D_suzukii]